MPSSRSFRAAAAIAAAFALASFFTACGRAAPPVASGAAPEHEAAISAKLVTAAPTQWSRRISATGEIAAWQEAIIGAEVGGMRINEVRVDVGQHVRKGQVLARFDERMLRVDLAQQTATLAQAKASFAKAQTDAERAERLQGSGSLSKQEYLQVRTAALTAEAGVQLAQAQLDAQALRLDFATVLAPDDGVISSSKVAVGSLVAGGAELFRLIRHGRLEWRPEVRGDALAGITPGMSASVRRSDGQVVTGTVRSVSPTLDPSTRNALVYVDLPEGAGLAAGMFLAGEFDAGTSTVLSLPESAIVFRDGNQYVMKVDAERRVHEVKVVTGRRQGGDIEVVAGIAAGEQFVSTGGGFVHDGDRIRVEADGAPAPAASAR